MQAAGKRKQLLQTEVAALHAFSSSSPICIGGCSAPDGALDLIGVLGDEAVDDRVRVGQHKRRGALVVVRVGVGHRRERHAVADGLVRVLDLRHLDRGVDHRACADIRGRAVIRHRHFL